MFSGAFCFCLGILVFSFDRKSVVNKLFLLTTLSLFYYTFTTVMMWLSQNPAEASFWNKMGAPWPFTVVLIFNCALAFTKNIWLKKPATYLALYFPAAFFFIVELFTDQINQLPVLRYWGFNDVASGSWLYYVSTVWAAVLTLGAVFVCTRYFYKTNDERQKKQRLLVTVGLAIPIIAFVTTNLIVRSFNIDIPNLGPITSAVFAGLVSYALLKYDLFTFDTALAADSIISSLPDPLVIINCHKKILRLNGHMLNFLGYKENELIGKGVEDILVPKYVEVLNKEFEKLCKEKIVANKELACLTRIGEQKEVIFSASIIQTRFGSPIGAACLFHDITERKKNQELQEKQAALINLGSSAIIVKNADGIITFWNTGAENLYGYTKQEAVGKKISVLLKAKYSESEDNIYVSLRRGQHWVGESTHYAKNNKEVVVQADWIAKLNERNEVLEVLESNIDITDRVNAQKALQLSEEKFRKNFAMTPIGISILNLDSNQFVDCNESFERLTGYKRDEIIGKSALEINLWTNQAKNNQIMDRLLREGTVEIQGLELTTKSQETKVVDAGFAVVEINGELHSISSFLDVTDRQKVEQELKENTVQIENLNEKLRILGTLTRHDVKNKLSVIKGNAYLLRKKLANSPELLSYVETIDLALDQSDRLLDLSRIYEKIGSEKLTRISVEESFNQAVNLVNKPGLRIFNKCKGLNVIADSMLSQLFYNLIDNSIKHGKTVTEIELSFNSEPSTIKLYYKDNGVGISDDIRSLIFSEGFTTGGSGLGLKLVKKMIESYGWTIEENGILNQGARFQITIPKSALFY